MQTGPIAAAGKSGDVNERAPNARLRRVLWTASLAYLLAAVGGRALLSGVAHEARAALLRFSSSLPAAAPRPPIFLGLSHTVAVSLAVSTGLFAAASTAVWLAARRPASERCSGTVECLLWGLAAGVPAAAAAIALTARDSAVGAGWAYWVHGLSRGSLPAALVVTLAVLVMPLASELAFRGAVLPALEESVGFGAATAASSALFGALWPLAGGWIAGAAVGLAAALVYRRTGSLVAPVVADFVVCASYLTIAWLFAVQPAWPR